MELAERTVRTLLQGEQLLQVVVNTVEGVIVRLLGLTAVDICWL
jgi:hypothetical protein